jgi:hypothetical protein
VSGVRSTVFGVLLVALYVYEPSNVVLSAPETVRLDRLAFSQPGGWTTEQHGDLLPPGSSTLRLGPGVYHFRTLSDAQLRLAPASSVQVITPRLASGKDPWPEPPPPPPPHLRAVQDSSSWAAHTDAFRGGGFGARERIPALLIIRSDDER